MRFRNTAILAVLVALLGAYLYWVERPAVEEESRPRPLLDFDPGTVSRLELTNGDQTIEAVREGGTWKIVAPIEAPADSRALDTLVETAAQAEQMRVVDESPSDLAPFGLAAPGATVRLWSGDTALPALAIGNGTPIGFNAYARRGEEPAVLLTGGTVRTALVKNLDDLRKKEVLDDVAESEVTSLTLKPREGEVVRLDRVDGTWRLVEPIDAPAAETTVRNLLGSLRALRAVEFVPATGPDAEQSRGLSPAALEVEIGSGDDATRLRVGDEIDLGDKKLVAAMREGSDQIFLVASHVPASLAKSASDLRDKSIVDLESAEVAEARVRRSDGETFSLVEKDDVWALGGETDRKTDALVAKRFVDDVLALEGDAVVSEENDLAAHGLDEPALRIELLDPQGETRTTVLAARADVDGKPVYTAALEGRGPVYGLRDYVYTRIDKRAADFEPVPATAPVSDSP